MKLRLIALLAAVCLLTGCTSLLEREYSTSEPHSSKFWESEAAGTLRAENYQDIVNDLLLLIGEHRETATLRLYHFKGDLTVADMVERATVEVQQETPFGAYAVEVRNSGAIMKCSCRSVTAARRSSCKASSMPQRRRRCIACWSILLHPEAMSWWSRSAIGPKMDRRAWKGLFNSCGSTRDWKNCPAGQSIIIRSRDRWV